MGPSVSPEQYPLYWDCVVNILLAYPRLESRLPGQEIAFFSPHLFMGKTFKTSLFGSVKPVIDMEDGKVQLSYLITQCLSFLIWKSGMLLLLLLFLSTNHKTIKNH